MAFVVGTNSYISVANADAYFADRLNGESWEVLDNSTKQRALVSASGQISLRLISDCQLPLAPADINAQVANASAEYALLLAEDPTILSQANTGTNTKRVRAGSAEVEFFQPRRGTRFPNIVTELLVASECLSTGSAATAPQGFGLDDESTFTNDERYGYNEGLA